MNHFEYWSPAPFQSVDLDLPLHEETDDGEAVASLVQNILTGVDDLAAGGAISGRDIVQALSIATAVHAAKVEVSALSGETLRLNLLDVRLEEERLN
jgi:hypothetical protein